MKKRYLTWLAAGMLGLAPLFMPVSALAEEVLPEGVDVIMASDEAPATDSQEAPAEQDARKDGESASGDSPAVATTTDDGGADNLSETGMVPDTSQASILDDAIDVTLDSQAESDGSQASQNPAQDGQGTTNDGRHPLPEGRFAMETGLAYGMVVDAKAGGTTNGTNVQLYRSNDSGAQRWYLEAQADGYYVVSAKSGLVLDVAGAKSEKGANVQLYTKNGSRAQLWLPMENGRGGWMLRSLLSESLVLDVSGASRSNGANLQLWESNGSDAQSFWFRKEDAGVAGSARSIDDGAYAIRAGVGSGIVADVAGGSTAAGANMQVYAGNGSNAQRFWATYANGFYTLQNTLTGLALELASGSPVAGANVRMAKPSHGAAQQWSVVAAGNGRYTLVNRAGGLVLDLAGGKAANGTNVQGYYANGSAAQLWSFVPTAPIADGTYFVADTKTGNVLDVQGASTSAGAAVQRYASNGSMAQRFRLKSVGGASYELRSVNSALWVGEGSGGKVVQKASATAWKAEWTESGLRLALGDRWLGFDAGGKAILTAHGQASTLRPSATTLITPGYYGIQSLLGTSLAVDGASRSTANVSARTADNSQAQLWYVASLGGDRYELTNVGSGFVLEVNGANVRQGRYANQSIQRWRASWNDKTGGITLTNLSTGKALDVAGASTKSGANVQQYQANASKAQTWRLVRRSAPALTAKQKRAVAAAKSTPTTPRGFCALWVSNVFGNAGIGYWSGNACDLYNWYCKDYNPASIKPGMIVSVRSHNKTAAGRIYGHVAVYVGNGMVMDSVGRVRTMSLAAWSEHYGDRVTVKWGWIGNRALA